MILWSKANLVGFFFESTGNLVKSNKSIDILDSVKCLVTFGFKYITWRWLHRNHANTITSVIAAKQTVINEVDVFSIKYRYSYSDILLKKKMNFI